MSPVILAASIFSGRGRRDRPPGNSFEEPLINRFAIVLACLAATLPRTACAIGSVQFSVASIESEQFSIKGMAVSLDVWPLKPTANISIQRLDLPEPAGAVSNVVIACGNWHLAAAILQAEQCRLTGSNALLPGLDATGSLRYELVSEALSVRFADLAFAGGTLSGTLALDAGGWKANLNGTLQAEALRQVLEPYSALLAGVSGEGTFDIAGNASGSDSGGVLDTTLVARDIAFSNTEGTMAGEGLQGQLQVNAQRETGSDNWRLSADIEVGSGETFFEPVYLNFNLSPLTARINTTLGADWQPAGHTRVEYRHANTLSVDPDITSMTTRPYRIDNADITMSEMRFPAAYRGYVKGFLVGTPLTNLQTLGRAQGHAMIRDGAAQQVSLVLDDIGADDPLAGFAIYDLAGQLQWRSTGTDADNMPVSELTMGGAFVSNISIGPSQARLKLRGAGWRFLEPVRLPIFEGALQIQTLAVNGMGSEDLSFEFQADLEPIGLRRLTTALNWPVFPGQLSGTLPLLSYQGGQVTVGGSLEAKAFDGRITLDALRIEQPFGLIPELNTTIRMRGLDLSLLTDVFTIGRIEGRLDGDIVDLKMIKGQPVAFNARFYTPVDDKSRRRISQRAVGSISGIAGDSRTPAISSGVMRFFQDFAYDRLGINCRLDNDVCHMSGIQPADRGYYLVKGRFLPRIDVIGFTSEVEWTRLVNQVQQALLSGETTITSP